MNTRFDIRTYGRTELARLYFPGIEAESAWRRLRSWMARCAPLCADLARLGYDPRRRTFTPAEVAAIADRLGEP